LLQLRMGKREGKKQRSGELCRLKEYIRREGTALPPTAILEIPIVKIKPPVFDTTLKLLGSLEYRIPPNIQSISTTSKSFHNRQYARSRGSPAAGPHGGPRRQRRRHPAAVRRAPARDEPSWW
ncbi:hypothetical protein CI238_07874, partial [Colletotrichum incanum]